MFAIAIGWGAGPAMAQRVLVQADGTVNVGYTQTTREPIQSDPMADKEDVLPTSVGSVVTEVRPAIVLQAGSPRLAWLAGYTFSGAFSPGGEDTVAYSNQVTAGLVGQISKYSNMAVNASVAQGGTSFLLSRRPAEQNTPELRAPGDPNMITATIAETFSREFSRQFTLSQSFSASLSAPQDELDNFNSSVTESVAIDHMYGRDNIGFEIRAGISRLRPLRSDLPRYSTITGAVMARWNHDFSTSWNALATAGVEQAYTDSGSQPLAFLPTGAATVRYTVGEVAAALEVFHGSATNIQVGTVSITDRVTGRGVLVLDALRSRVVSFSAGVLHNEPLGEVAAIVAAGTGNAVQADGGFTTAISKKVLANARYSMAYQFGQSGGLSPTLAHIFLVGITARYDNIPESRRKMPRRGLRVDGSDGEGFPVVPDGAP